MKIFYLFFILAMTDCKSQRVTPCSCKAFIDLNVHESVRVIDKPNGRLVKLIQYNPSDEDFLQVDIDKVSDSFFHANLQYDMSGKSFTGWFLKKDYLVTFVKNYSATVKLYSSPATSSSISATIATGSSDAFEIQNCKDNWLFVKAKSKKKLAGKNGWLQAKNQCANPFTTCN